MNSVRGKISGLKRQWLGMVLIGMILLFAGGCASSNQEDAATSPLDGTNNIPCGGLSVTRNDTIYYIGEWEEGGEAIYAMDLSGENIRTIYTPERYKNMLSYLNIDGDRLYFCEEVINDDFGHDETQINVLDLSDSSDSSDSSGSSGSSGSSVKKLYGSIFVSSPIYFYKDHIYFGESMPPEEVMAQGYTGDSQVMVMDPDGKNLTSIINYYDNFIIYEDMIYYVAYEDMIDYVSYMGLSRCNLKGNHKESVYKDDNGIAGLQVVDDKLYFVEYRNEAAPYFMSVDLDGGNPQRVFEDEFGGVFMANAIDHKIYLGTAISMGIDPKITLMTVDLDGSGKGTIVSTDDYGVMGHDDYKIMGDIKGGCCISGDWLFYAALDDHNGRVLYKEKRAE